MISKAGQSQQRLDTDEMLAPYNDSSEDEDSPVPSQRPKYGRDGPMSRYLLMIAATVSLCMLSAMIFASHRLKLREGNPSSMRCGNTSAEARSRSCKYEPMQHSWIPAACYFPEPSDEYDPFNDREWFLDMDLTQPLNKEHKRMLRRGDDLNVYAKYYHNEHCLYNWRKLAIAVNERRIYIDSKTISLAHSTHCAKSIADVLIKSELHTYNNTGYFTSAPLLFHTCVPLFLE